MSHGFSDAVSDQSRGTDLVFRSGLVLIPTKGLEVLIPRVFDRRQQHGCQAFESQARTLNGSYSVLDPITVHVQAQDWAACPGSGSQNFGPREAPRS